MSNGTEPLTHKFEIKIGNVNYKGMCEFNTDGKAGFLATPDIHLELDARQKIQNVFQAVLELHKLLGDPLKKVVIQEIGRNE